MKAISPELKARMQRGVTTLASCIRVRRRDAKSFYFTDHDEPLEFENQTYLPYHAFSRASVPTSIELEVDSSEFRAILNSKAVKREEIANGLFDYAEVEIFLVDYELPTAGKCSLRLGWLGEVQTREDGTYIAEIRGLTQVLAQRLGDAYTPECRTDLGSKLCKMPLAPPEWLANTPYAVGENVTVEQTPVGAHIDLPLQNSHFNEDAIDAGQPGAWFSSPKKWTGYGGALWAVKNQEFGNLTQKPPDGDKFLAIVGGSNKGGIYQDLDLTALDVDLDQIDTGRCRLRLPYWVAQINKDDSDWRVRISAGSQVIYDTGKRRVAEDRWWRQVINNVVIPAGTRSIRIDLYGTKKGSNLGGSCFDQVGPLTLYYADTTATGAVQYEYVAFQCVTGGVSGETQPDFSQALDDITVDGTVEWKTVKSMRSAPVDVELVAGPRTYRFSYMDEPDEWYTDGLLKWETGLNAGTSFEIKSHVNDTVELHQRPFYPVAAGDRATLYPGCDGRFRTCVDKFDNALNFRGEPHVPGQDEYYRTPNAKMPEE